MNENRIKRMALLGLILAVVPVVLDFNIIAWTIVGDDLETFMAAILMLGSVLRVGLTIAGIVLCALVWFKFKSTLKRAKVGFIIGVVSLVAFVSYFIPLAINFLL